MKFIAYHFALFSLLIFTLSGCAVVLQTYTPSKLNPPPSASGFLPDGYRDDFGHGGKYPAVSVLVVDTSGKLEVSVCSQSWDYRKIKILAEESDLSDARGDHYRLSAFQSEEYTNSDIGISRWISYSTHAVGPLPSTARHRSYSTPHILRVVYTEDGKRFTAERHFAATYPLITPYHFIRAFSQHP